MDPVKAEQLLDEIEALERVQKETARSPQELFASNIIKRIRFRLMGYDLQGNVVPWEKDVEEVRNVERTLVIDPHELKNEFERIRSVSLSEREALEQGSKFEKRGGHTYLMPADILYRVRREGWIILAGIELPNDQFHTIGYNYGLNSMPDIDDEFMMLDRDTLSVPDDTKREWDLDKIAINWRTGIMDEIDADVARSAGLSVPDEQKTVSMRRLGIASALKYIITFHAKELGREQIMFNIGTLYDIKSKAKLRNGPSFHHNTRIFSEEFSYRNRPNYIVIKGDRGEREPVAKVRWYARGDNLDNALGNLTSSKSKLMLSGWDLERLRKDWALNIVNPLDSEKAEGEHV
jgi:hypothetical protein